MRKHHHLQKRVSQEFFRLANGAQPQQRTLLENLWQFSVLGYQRLK